MFKDELLARYGAEALSFLVMGFIVYYFPQLLWMMFISVSVFLGHRMYSRLSFAQYSKLCKQLRAYLRGLGLQHSKTPLVIDSFPMFISFDIDSMLFENLYCTVDEIRVVNQKILGMPQGKFPEWITETEIIPLLKVFKLDSCVIEVPALCMAISRMTEITEISVINCNLSAKNLSLILEIIANCKFTCLERLVLSDNPFCCETPSSKTESHILCNLKSILESNTNLDLVHLSSRLSTFSVRSSTTVSQSLELVNSLRPMDMCVLNACIGVRQNHSPPLLSLVLRGNEITKESLDTLLNYLAHHENSLTKLEFPDYEFNEQSLKRLSMIAQKNTNLKILQIKHQDKDCVINQRLQKHIQDNCTFDVLEVSEGVNSDQKKKSSKTHRKVQISPLGIFIQKRGGLFGGKEEQTISYSSISHMDVFYDRICIHVVTKGDKSCLKLSHPEGFRLAFLVFLHSGNHLLLAEAIATLCTSEMSKVTDKMDTLSEEYDTIKDRLEKSISKSKKLDKEKQLDLVLKKQSLLKEWNEKHRQVCEFLLQLLKESSTSSEYLDASVPLFESAFC